jgi:hypothetical protein
LTPSAYRFIVLPLPNAGWPRGIWGNPSDLGNPANVTGKLEEEPIMSKLLYIGTHGTDDPTKATFPFLMAQGALEAGHETGIILMGEAAPLIKDHIAAQVQGIGVPPLKQLLDGLISKNIRITV